MSTTLDLPIDLNLDKTEFAQSCSATDCPREATWIAWTSHARDACPHEGYLCDEHKTMLVRLWELELRNLSRCRRCRITITGQVSDHLRLIKL